MREFFNPFKIFSPPKAQAPVVQTQAASVTKDGDEPAKKKKTRGISTQRSTLLTAGSAVGQDTQRRSLLGVS